MSRPNARSEAIEAYFAGSTALRGAVEGMSPAQVVERPVVGRWSTLEVVAHLADSEQAWTHRMKRVIAENTPLLIGYDESKFTSSLFYQDRDLNAELTLFDLLRYQMTQILRALPEPAWLRQGVHSESGLLSLEQMLQIETDHVHHHLRHIQEKRQALGLKPSESIAAPHSSNNV